MDPSGLKSCARAPFGIALDLDFRPHWIRAAIKKWTPVARFSHKPHLMCSVSVWGMGLIAVFNICSLRLNQRTDSIRQVESNGGTELIGTVVEYSYTDVWSAMHNLIDLCISLLVRDLSHTNQSACKRYRKLWMPIGKCVHCRVRVSGN